MKIIKFIFLILLTVFSYSCEGFIEPTPNEHMREWQVLQNRDNFRGALYETYSYLPIRQNFIFEAATDNAVTNNDNTVSSRMARGGISAVSNELDNMNQNGINGTIWVYNFTNINMINYVLDKLLSGDIQTRFNIDDPSVNDAWIKLLKGEGYFLRAWYEFEQLKTYGGPGPDGVMYGFPIMTKYTTYKDELDLPRNTYQQCVDQILSDCDQAIANLAFHYDRLGGAIWDGGTSGIGRASGLAAMALKTKTLLYAASPAFNPGNDVEKWRKAATMAKDLIDRTGFDDLMSLEAYYVNHRLSLNNDANALNNNPDMFFRGRLTNGSRTMETENFYPRASGDALYQPSQNLVDAFPMSDGYPISAASADFPYNINDMYANRDPRLETFILYDGQPTTFGATGLDPAVVQTKPGGADAFGSHDNATRTGYYLKKWLYGGVRNIGSVVSTDYTAIIFSRPELYLTFAEAALQATGNPDDKSFGYSPREVLAKVRDRALGEDNDKYLPTVTGKDQFLEVIKNERRVELCFESHRFWDLRRWAAGKNDMAAINAPVYGMYSTTPVETRQFNSPYFPIPYGELLTAKNIVNNDGW